MLKSSLLEKWKQIVWSLLLVGFLGIGYVCWSRRDEPERLPIPVREMGHDFALYRGEAYWRAYSRQGTAVYAAPVISGLERLMVRESPQYDLSGPFSFEDNALLYHIQRKVPLSLPQSLSAYRRLPIAIFSMGAGKPSPTTGSALQRQGAMPQLEPPRRRRLPLTGGQAQDVPEDKQPDTVNSGIIETVYSSIGRTESVEFQGRLYHLAKRRTSDSRAALEMRLISANPDGSDPHILLSFSQGKSLPVALWTHRDSLYFLRAPLSPAAVTPSGPRPSLQLCRLTSSRTERVEVVRTLPNAIEDLRLDQDYLYFILREEPHTLWENLTGDDRTQGIVLTLCRIRLPG